MNCPKVLQEATSCYAVRDRFRGQLVRLRSPMWDSLCCISAAMKVRRSTLSEHLRGTRKSENIKQVLRPMKVLDEFVLRLHSTPRPMRT